MKGLGLFRRIAERIGNAPETHKHPTPDLTPTGLPPVPLFRERSWAGGLDAKKPKRNAGANQLREWFPGLGKLVSTRDGKPV